MAARLGRRNEHLLQGSGRLQCQYQQAYSRGSAGCIGRAHQVAPVFALVGAAPDAVALAREGDASVDLLKSRKLCMYDTLHSA